MYFQWRKEGRLPPELLQKEYDYEKLQRARHKEDPYSTEKRKPWNWAPKDMSFKNLWDYIKKEDID